MGVPVIKSLKKKHLDKINNWVAGKQYIPINYPNSTERIINMIIKKQEETGAGKNVKLGEGIYSKKKLKEKSLGKILNELAE